MPSVEQIRDIFEPLTRGDAAAFFEHVEDDVDWIVKGSASFQIAGHYKSKSALRAGTQLLNSVWATPVKMVVQHVVYDGSHAVVEMKAQDTLCQNGMPFENDYVWICQFNQAGKIAQVRAYMDTDSVSRAIIQNFQ